MPTTEEVKKPDPQTNETQYDIVDGLVRSGIPIGAVNCSMESVGLEPVADYDEAMAILSDTGATAYPVMDHLVRTALTIGSVNACMLQSDLAPVADLDEVLTILAGSSEAPALPVNEVAPAVTGTPQVGQTLTCNPGTWSGTPTFTYQWRANSTNIASNATNATYVPIAAQVGKSLDCMVKGTNANGNASVASNSVGPIVA